MATFICLWVNANMVHIEHIVLLHILQQNIRMGSGLMITPRCMTLTLQEMSENVSSGLSTKQINSCLSGTENKATSIHSMPILDILPVPQLRTEHNGGRTTAQSDKSCCTKTSQTGQSVSAQRRD